PGHVQWYCDFYSAVTGEFVEPGDLITMSERIYNFQKIFNLRMSGGRREQDAIPYRAIGPATKEEYLYSSNYYDDILLKEFGIEDFKDLPLGFKMQIFRGRKLEAYERLKLKAYERRGWNENGIPIIETLKRVGLDLDWITRVIKQGKKGVRK
ncbi:MAG: aldehyde ferredoxin oxidoreductase C-terminal domain-containing protein, partial [Patescibacteria group bacterium]